MYKCVDLLNHFNNLGISNDKTRIKANFTGMGSSYPFEQIASCLDDLEIDIPFKIQMGDDTIYDNFELYNQYVMVPVARYSRIHFVGASENGSFEETVLLKGRNNIEKIKLGLTDWIAEKPRFNELLISSCEGINTMDNRYVKGLESKLWLQSVDVKRLDDDLIAIEFPDNPAMHIFSITLEELINEDFGK